MNAMALATLDRVVEVVDEETAAAEVALGALFDRAERLHRSNIEHDPLRCLTCFTTR